MRNRFTALASAVALTAGLAWGATAQAGGFEEFTVEEIEETTATCDFDGDGTYLDYVVTPGQVVEQKTLMTEANGLTRVTILNKFDHVEYTYDGAEPDAFYNTSEIRLMLMLGPEGLSFQIRSYAMYTDATGAVLYQGPGNFDIVIEDGEPVDYITRGQVPPCVPGF